MKKAQDKYRFQLYALCIMSNHVHYLMEPTRRKRRFTQNYAFAELVHCHVFQSNAQSDGAFLGKALSQYRVCQYR
jgi:hypothetical protein